MEERKREATVSIKEKFESKFFVSPDGCWLWVEYVDKDGYGRFRVADKKLRAHRVSYELYVDEIPNGLVLDHLCRKTGCVNPNHLEVVTVRENTLRGINKKLCTHGNGFSMCKDGDCSSAYRQYRKKYLQDYRKRGN